MYASLKARFAFKRRKDKTLFFVNGDKYVLNTSDLKWIADLIRNRECRYDADISSAGKNCIKEMLSSGAIKKRNEIIKKPFLVKRVAWLEAKKTIEAIRLDVFINEQGIDEAIEWDGLDERAWHWLVLSPEKRGIATARLLVLRTNWKNGGRKKISFSGNRLKPSCETY